MHIRFHHKKRWRLFVDVVLGLLILLLLSEILFHDQIVEIIPTSTIEMLELLFTGILALDLTLWYLEARNKYNFVRRNWIRIIAIFPFVPVFRFAQILRLEQLFAFAFSSEMVMDVLATERLLKFEKGIKAITKASEFIKEIR